MWLSPVAFLAASSILLVPVAGKIESPCALSNVLMNKFGVKKANAANWACLAKFASGYNTQALGTTHKDGSEDFGIFQINDKFCRRGTKTNCGASCTDLVSDDIVPSATCALYIFKKEGFAHWPAWKDNCKDISVSRFIENCEVKPK